MAAAPDEILSLVVFARVVEAGSFTGAARALGLSKSVVSVRVSQLEERLHVQLLRRSTRKLTLTPEGRALFDRCARLLLAADEAVGAAESTGNTPTGLLRVNAPVAFAQAYLAPPMAAYLKEHPHVRIDLALSDKHVDLIDEGVDVAIRITSRLEGAGLVARKLAADRTVLCASPAYLARRGVPTSPSDLTNHDCLVYSLLRAQDEWRFRTHAGIQELPIEGRFSAASGVMLQQAVRSGMGLAVLPRFMVAADLKAGLLRSVLDSFVGVDLGIYAVYPRTRRPPARVRAFIDVLVKHFKTPRWPGL